MVGFNSLENIKAHVKGFKPLTQLIQLVTMQQRNTNMLFENITSI